MAGQCLGGGVPKEWLQYCCWLLSVLLGSSLVDVPQPRPAAETRRADETLDGVNCCRMQLTRDSGFNVLPSSWRLRLAHGQRHELVGGTYTSG